MRLGHKLALIALLPLVLSCATYSSKIRNARGYFEVGQYDAAIEDLKKLVAANDKDQLLYLMDLGLIYHTAGRYQEAIEVFLRADKLAEIKDYTSLGEEAASVILNDEVKPYKGENFEKVLINAYLAIDYTLAGKHEDALVECRRVNHKLDLMISQGGLPYEHNAFAKYLSAVLFESQREYNDALVDYRAVLKWVGEYPHLGVPLLRMADRLKAEQELEQFRKKFPETKSYKLKKGEGEIIALVEVGKAPIKVPHPNFDLLPKFQKRYFEVDHVVLRDTKHSFRADSATLFDIEHTAITELDHRVGGIMAKKIGGVVAKQIIAAQVAKQTKSEGLGLLTAWILHATDQADLRSWTTLPARLQVARVTVPAGRHEVALDMVSPSQETRLVKQWPAVDVKPGQLVFLNYRVSE